MPIPEFLYYLIFPIFAGGIIIYFIREKLRKRSGYYLKFKDIKNE